MRCSLRCIPMIDINLVCKKNHSLTDLLNNIGLRDASASKNAKVSWNILCMQVQQHWYYFVCTQVYILNVTRESVDGTHSCRCRRDMAWNSRTLECQVSPINWKNTLELLMLSQHTRGTSCILSPLMYPQCSINGQNWSNICRCFWTSTAGISSTLIHPLKRLKLQLRDSNTSWEGEHLNNQPRNFHILKML